MEEFIVANKLHAFITLLLYWNGFIYIYDTKFYLVAVLYICGESVLTISYKL